MLSIASLSAAPALAQVEACDGPFSLVEWLQAMDEVDRALIALDGSRADLVLDHVIDESRCLDEVVPPDVLGRFARQVSVVAFFAQDPDELAYWALLARETAGGAPWPPELPVPDRYHELVADLGEPRVDTLPGVGFAPPKGGAVLVDGFFAASPTASVGVQHLVQVGDKKGLVVSTTWQTGTSFPEGWLEEGDSELEAPRWYEAPPEPPPIEVPEPAPEPVEVDEPTVSFDGDGRSADCPWKGEPRKASVKGRTVSINRQTFTVRGDEAQAEFKAVLRSCGEFRAVRRFTRWQDARKKLFSSGKRYRDAMLKALLTEEPARQGRR